MDENTQQRNKLQFGLNGAAPEHAKAVWGARAIFHGGRYPYLDILWDRQDAYGSGEDRYALQQVLNEGAIHKVQERFKDLVQAGELKESLDELFELYNDGRCVVVGNPRSSYGYMYLAAWLLPSH